MCFQCPDKRNRIYNEKADQSEDKEAVMPKYGNASFQPAIILALWIHSFWHTAGFARIHLSTRIFYICFAVRDIHKCTVDSYRFEFITGHAFCETCTKRTSKDASCATCRSPKNPPGDVKPHRIFPLLLNASDGGHDQAEAVLHLLAQDKLPLQTKNLKKLAGNMESLDDSLRVSTRPIICGNIPLTNMVRHTGSSYPRDHAR